MGRRLKQTDYSRGCCCAPARPHDLLWARAQSTADDTPAWALPILAQGGPFVVRRAPRVSARIPVGVRGRQRPERFATTIDRDAVTRIVTPEQLAARIAQPAAGRLGAIAALDALPQLAATLDLQNMSWGLTGAVGYELATGQPVCHEASDIDVLLRVPQPITRLAARKMMDSLAALAPRCDIQMETRLGGVALADWAAGNDRVLVKSDQGPFLCADPWREAPPVQSACYAAGN